MTGSTTRRPWYEDYFGSEFWTVAEHEYTAERTGREVDYLAAALGRNAPGRRVLDLGCGTGRHAIALAARGFQVTGLDVSEWALAHAAEAACAAGVEAAWVRCDLLRTRPLPVPTADAAICVQSFGLGSDAEQLRLLREVRRRLVPGGLLILDHSSVLAIVRHYAPEATFQADGLRADFHRSFRTISGRSVGSVVVSRDGGADEPAVLRDDVRLYQPAEVRGLLEQAGFEVERVDADFTADAEVGIETRYVQFLARNPNSRHAHASIDAYRRDGSAAPEQRLDLRWTPDEIEFVRPAVDLALRVARQDDFADIAREYAVADPYSGARAAPVLSAHFACDLTPDMVTAGAGITGLLQSLAAFAQPGPVLCQAGGHPDLPRRAELAGARVYLSGPRPDALRDELAARRPALVLLDRPTITGEFADIAFVSALCEEAAAWAATVVVDEAYATYGGPSASCVPLVTRHANLVVLRSMSKGYCCGGLRIGFALAGTELTARLREVVPELSANSVGLAVALRLLEQGDVFGPLRSRIAAVKPLVADTLREAGLHVDEGAHQLPWITAPADDAARKAISGRSLIVKDLPGLYGETMLRIALPLAEERLRAFRALFDLPDVP
jgi:histidinol-phosphate/aromatic aminotransferase/cobyric acid decarboxylase-like protein/SAM-dependent methyltransferase